jgi:hypothetical protein
MPKAPRDRDKPPPPGYDGDGKDRELYDDPDEHLEIERQRYRGGLSPTPALYARARQQWYRLPGSLVKPPMDPVGEDPGTSEQQPASEGQRKDERGE